MAEQGHDDGYAGPATLTVGGSRFDVHVELRGQFQPIDGRYHWYGRVGRHEGLLAALGSGKVSGTIATAERSASCELSDPDPWGRYRVGGVSTPPFVASAEMPDAGSTTDHGEAGVEGAGQREAGEAEENEAEENEAEENEAEENEAEENEAEENQPQALPAHVRVAIIGAGFGGIGAGIRLRQAGRTDFVILERASSIGGTWRDNSYPGCCCDVPSHLYSFSFAPNPEWTRSFSSQADIWDYLERVTDGHGVRGHIRLEAEVTGARWDASANRWRIRTTAGDLSADVLISAAGPLSEPKLPDVPGLASFPGEVFHSARWHHGLDLDGKRVALVGTGSSSIQIVPEIQPTASRLVLFQRTPGWVMPVRNRRITEWEKRLYRNVPAAQRLARLGVYLSREALVVGFVKRPELLRAAQRSALKNMERSIADPALRAKLTPSYVMGCKRILLSNSYYPALAQPNVEVVAAGLAKVDGSMVTAQDGTAREVDTIVFATGFRATEMPIARRIYGAAGTSLAEAWGGTMRALRGTTVPGFPNLCLVIGPNTGLGHSSLVHIIESQLNYILDYLATLDRAPGAALDARRDAEQRWCADIERRMARTVWTTGGCVSWYLTPDGRNPTLWPGSTMSFRRATRRLDPREYDVIRPAATA